MTDLALGAFTLIAMGSVVTAVIAGVALAGLGLVEWFKYGRSRNE
jgi:hypothetical protein